MICYQNDAYYNMLTGSSVLFANLQYKILSSTSIVYILLGFSFKWPYQKSIGFVHILYSIYKMGCTVWVDCWPKQLWKTMLKSCSTNLYANGKLFEHVYFSCLSPISKSAKSSRLIPKLKNEKARKFQKLRFARHIRFMMNIIGLQHDSILYSTHPQNYVWCRL